METKIEQMTAIGILGLLRQHHDLAVAGFVTTIADGGLWMKLDRDETRAVLRELPPSELIYATVQVDPPCLMLGIQMEALDTYEMSDE